MFDYQAINTSPSRWSAPSAGGRKPSPRAWRVHKARGSRRPQALTKQKKFHIKSWIWKWPVSKWWSAGAFLDLLQTFGNFLDGFSAWDKNINRAGNLRGLKADRLNQICRSFSSKEICQKSAVVQGIENIESEWVEPFDNQRGSEPAFLRVGRFQNMQSQILQGM